MGLRKPAAALLVIFLVTCVSAISASTSTNSCSQDEEALVSLNFTDGGHVGEPGFYDTDVCLSGIESLEIQEGACSSDEKFMFSMKKLNNSHISIYENAYTYSVCSQSVEPVVRNSCFSNETKVLAVASDNNTHAAEPGYSSSTYDKSLCFGIPGAQNVTLKLQSPKIDNDVYVDENTISSGETMLPPFAFPYIVTENPVKGIVSTGGVNSISRPETDEVKITQEVGNSFIVPYTTGSYREVEDEEREISNNEFLSQVSPSFSFADVDSPTVKVIHLPDYKVKGFDSTFYSGPFKLKVENQGLGNGNATFQLTPQ